ncbi:MAG: hypothetical protein H0V51_01065 [Chloroflexi bacterium]|nr:hypothetical protein [Chloroflexota bacterium]
MDPKTSAHLETAARNRDIAALVAQSSSLDVQPPPFEWAVVVAFYSAVHYVNAYLWEKQRYEPPDHGARRNAVLRIAELRVADSAYANLRDLAHRARYRPRFRLPRADAEHVLRADLPLVERTVLGALNASP